MSSELSVPPCLQELFCVDIAKSIEELESCNLVSPCPSFFEHRQVCGWCSLHCLTSFHCALSSVLGWLVSNQCWSLARSYYRLLYSWILFTFFIDLASSSIIFRYDSSPGMSYHRHRSEAAPKMCPVGYH